MELTLEGWKNNLAVAYNQQQAENTKFQQQVMHAEKLFKEAASNAGGAGTLTAPKIREEDCHMEKFKETTDAVDFKQWVRTLELSLETHYDWKFADLVVQANRHEKASITVIMFADISVKINKDEEERDRTMHQLQLSDWDFDEKTRLLYRY